MGVAVRFVEVFWLVVVLITDRHATISNQTGEKKTIFFQPLKFDNRIIEIG